MLMLVGGTMRACWMAMLLEQSLRAKHIDGMHCAIQTPHASIAGYAAPVDAERDSGPGPSRTAIGNAPPRVRRFT